MVRKPDRKTDADTQKPSLVTQVKRWAWASTWRNPASRDAYLAKARRRIGETPEERLAWVLEQKGKLGSLRPGEHVLVGQDLRACAFMALAPTGGYDIPLDDMPRGRLAGYLEAIDAGIRGLLAEESKPWPFDATPRVVLHEGTLLIQFHGDEHAGILGGIAHLIVEVGDRLRACKECGNPFVAKRRQERYCDPRCSERYWNQQRTSNKKEHGDG